MSRNYDLHMESLAIDAHARIGGEKDDGRNRTFTLQRGNLIVTILSTHVKTADGHEPDGVGPVVDGPAVGPASARPADVARDEAGPVPPAPAGGADTPAPRHRQRGRRSCECVTELIGFLSERRDAFFTDFMDEFGEEYGDTAIARALKRIVTAGIATHPTRQSPYHYVGAD